MKIFNKLCSTLLLMGMWVAGYGQSTDSLVYYLELAARNNPAVQQKFSEYQAALQKVPQAGSLSDPELNLGVFLSPMELVGGNQVADIRLMQMFPWFGVLKAAKDEMSLMANARFESFRDVKLQVFFDLQQSWYELYKIQQSGRISEKNLEILRTLERLSLVKFKSMPQGSGNVSPSDRIIQQGSSAPSVPGSSAMQSMGGTSGISGSGPGGNSPAMQNSQMASSGGAGLTELYRIQMEIGELENNIALLKSRRNTVAAQFNSILNRPMQTPVSVPDTIMAAELNISLTAVSDSILNNHPMLEMLRMEEKSLEARKRMVTRMGYPMVGVGLNYSLINKNEMSSSMMNGSDMVMPMLTVTLPIYRKKYKAMQAEALLQKTATVQGLSAAANTLQSEFYAVVENFHDAQRRVALYTRQNQLAQQSLNILMKSFSASGAGLSELLRVRQQTLDYDLKQVESVADFNIAVARLNRLMAHSPIKE